ncbi:MAG: hypothetical protein HQK86_09340 [Nitrospinae bacterium]|nr:hypothetical protein [Nitrospinota bacterium]MBF0633094.1 hypothetical protein [Nitrospinota bacterium]
MAKPTKSITCIYMIIIGFVMGFFVEGAIIFSVIGVILLPITIIAELITDIKEKGALLAVTEFAGRMGLLIFFIALIGAIMIPGMKPEIFSNDPGPLLMMALVGGIATFFISAIIQLVLKKRGGGRWKSVMRGIQP